MEGIMMRHKDKYSIAVRKPDKEIEVKIEDYKSVIPLEQISKMPIVPKLMPNIRKLPKTTRLLNAAPTRSLWIS